uniref:26S proteasome non-ATPase regulatory subunit 4 homolog n=1 Tax=Tetraselmis sp. GSL018 TaxID=582737 RepID=A0A061RPU3_9CHLO
MEATVVCIDNSEWTRNGDFAPTRFQSQADAVNLLAGARTQAHPENTVGILTMAGKTPRVLVTPTPDLGKVLHCMQDVEIEGQCHLSTAVQIAQLCLKHRQNKNQRQRIVIFSGSPVSEEKEKLVKIGKKLKKNNVALDIVNFGSDDDNSEKLEAFHGAVNSSDNSHLVSVPAGVVLSDTLMTSPVFQQDGGSGFGGAAGGEGGAGAGAGGGDGFEFGVDPNLDPELALALRVSLEEERARQNAAAAAAGGEQEGGGSAANEAAPAAAAADEAVPMDEDALLQQALAMSMATDSQAPKQGEPAKKSADTEMAAGDEANEELQMALRMSMEENLGESEKEGASGSGGLKQERFPNSNAVLDIPLMQAATIPTARLWPGP